VKRQLVLLSVPKSSHYYQPRRTVKRQYQDAVLKEELQQMYIDLPFYGVPRATAALQKMGYKVNHKHVRRSAAVGRS